MEQLALAVLRRDKDSLAAALALADAVSELHREGGMHLPPVTRITADASRLRLAVFTREGMRVPDEDRHRFAERLASWVRGDGGAIAVFPAGVERIELYELPAASTPPA